MCWAGTEGDSNVMILELLGPSLEVTHFLSTLPKPPAPDPKPYTL
jgi:hypothetical protein